MHTEHNQPQQKESSPHPSQHPKHSYEGILSVIGTLLFLVAAPLIAVVLTMFVFQSYEVDGPSMQQTLQNQDRLIVYKLPRTMARITKKPFIPKRYEIVIFERSDLGGTADLGGDGNKQLIKRVIGLPGERVVVKDGVVVVYNKEHPDGFNPDEGQEYAKSIETNPGEVNLVVPENEVFVMGDNRTNSLDSRYFGTVSANELVGELVYRLWPAAKRF